MRFCMGEITDYFSWKNFHIGLEKNFRVEVGGVHRVFKTFMRSNGLYNRINISIDGEGRVYRLSSSNYLRICCEIIVILNIVQSRVPFHPFERVHESLIENSCFCAKRMFHCFKLSIVQTCERWRVRTICTNRKLSPLFGGFAFFFFFFKYSHRYAKFRIIEEQMTSTKHNPWAIRYCMCYLFF